MSVCLKSWWSKNKGTHWISLLIDRNTAVYFDSIGTEYIPQGVLRKIKDKSITHTTYLEYKMTMLLCYYILFLW